MKYHSGPYSIDDDGALEHPESFARRQENPLYEQFERDLAERQSMDAAWCRFIDMLTGGGLEVPDEALDEEEALEAGICAWCGEAGAHSMDCGAPFPVPLRPRGPIA